MNKREWMILVVLASPSAFGFQRTAAPAVQENVTAKVVQTANAFLATLTPAERAKGTFGFTSSQRTGWSNLPTGIFQRNGLRFGDMTAAATRSRAQAGCRSVEPRGIPESHRHHER